MAQTSPLSRHLWTAACTITLVTAAVAVGVPGVAHAESYRFIRAASWSNTDSTKPRDTVTGASLDAKVGTWLDPADKKHTSRAYFTFDLSAYRSATLTSATFVFGETAVNDCTATRTIELWATDPPHHPITWQHAPRERQLVSSGNPAGYGCPSSYMEIDATAAVRQSLGDSGVLTLELRVPEDVERQVALGRSVANNPGIQLTYNHAPDVPTDLAVEGRACGSAPIEIASLQPSLSAKLTDPDVNDTGGGQDPLSATFAIWPVDNPERRTELAIDFAGYTPTSVRASVQAGVLADGGSYAFQVKANDRQVDSTWSPPCQFHVDATPPALAPTVASTDYPTNVITGGVGIPGVFTFSANGDTDVVGFRYGQWSPLTYVAADQPGGQATVSITPTSTFWNQIVVQGIDRVGNPSPTASYDFYVKDVSPDIGDDNPTGAYGEPRNLTFTPNMEGVVSYVYSFNGGAETSVPAHADGTAAVTIEPKQSGSNVVIARSVTASGFTSPDGRYGFYLQTAPTVTSNQWPIDTSAVGAPIRTAGAFTFTPRMPNVTSYTYSFDGEPEQTVTADTSGSATVSYTPLEPWGHTLYVVSHGDIDSEQGSYSFSVGSLAPAVSSAEYPAWSYTGSPGLTGTFVFTPTQTGVVSYVYQIDGGAEQTVSAGSNGTATITWTPVVGGSHGLTVRSVNQAGESSDLAYHSFTVNPRPPLITHSNQGAVYALTFTSALAGSTEFVYVLDNGAEQSIPVGPDGTATITWSVAPSQVHSVSVYSRTPGGVRSGAAGWQFWAAG